MKAHLATIVQATRAQNAIGRVAKRARTDAITKSYDREYKGRAVVKTARYLKRLSRSIKALYRAGTSFFKALIAA